MVFSLVDLMAWLLTGKSSQFKILAVDYENEVAPYLVVGKGEGGLFWILVIG